jgi:LAO/AO transport system kinase
MVREGGPSTPFRNRVGEKVNLFAGWYKDEKKFLRAPGGEPFFKKRRFLPPAGMSNAAAVLAGDRRAAARLLSRAEAGDATIAAELRTLYRAGGTARVIGVTGPPGAGKSTVVDGLVARWRQTGQRIAVISVDPSSPISGGAVLGDRIRMSRHAEDAGVFIRSMAARGALGGLAPATGDAVTILDAMRFDIIIIETVGIGQSEMDILAHAGAVLLLQTAHGGDDVQMVKAGILEIADIFVVNKSDTAGSDKFARVLAEVIAHATQRADGWVPPVVQTIGVNGSGLAELISAVAAFFARQADRPEADLARKRRQVRARVLALADAALRRRFTQTADAALAAQIDAVIARDCDPHDLAASFMPGGAA